MQHIIDSIIACGCQYDKSSTRFVQSRVGGQLLLDPTSDEIYHEDAAVLMAFMPNANLV